MGRPKKLEQDKKIKISVSVDKTLYFNLKKDGIIPSKFFDSKLEEYYGKKIM